MECEDDIAGLLTKLATIKGHLPTGSPLSPILSYFSNSDTWASVAAICDTHGLTFTVYIDDITVSGTKVPDKLVWEIKKEIRKGGLRYHKEKKFVDRPAEVTGVIIANGTLDLPRRQHKKRYETHRELVGAVSHNSDNVAQVKARLAGLSGQFGQLPK